jgi:hypothetical protein
MEANFYLSVAFSVFFPEIGSHKLFAQAGFKQWFSGVARITGVSRWHPAAFSINQKILHFYIFNKCILNPPC